MSKRNRPNLLIGKVLVYKLEPEAQKVVYDGKLRSLKNVVTITACLAEDGNSSPFEVLRDIEGNAEAVQIRCSPTTAVQLAKRILFDLGDL